MGVEWNRIPVPATICWSNRYIKTSQKYKSISKCLMILPISNRQFGSSAASSSSALQYRPMEALKLASVYYLRCDKDGLERRCFLLLWCIFSKINRINQQLLLSVKIFLKLSGVSQWCDSSIYNTVIGKQFHWGCCVNTNVTCVEKKKSRPSSEPWGTPGPVLSPASDYRI